MKVRLPYRAGSFYAASESRLRAQINECFLHNFGPQKLPRVREGEIRETLSLISPHAGYMYSGPVAANGFFHIAQEGRPEAIILVGPNHTGCGSGVSMMREGFWRTPLGDVEIDSKLAKNIQSFSEYIDIDDKGHLYEHAIEVQLPFLQYIYGFFRIVPISMMMQDLEVSQDVGRAIARAAAGKNALIIASTDFSHYEPQDTAKAKDGLALDAIIRLDEELLQSVVITQNISMCGWGPASVAIVASKELGAKKAVVLQYKTSGDVTGEVGQVVGYASIAITK